MCSILITHFNNTFKRQIAIILGPDPQQVILRLFMQSRIEWS